MNTESIVETSDINTNTVVEAAVVTPAPKTGKGKTKTGKGKTGKGKTGKVKSSRGRGRPPVAVKMIMGKAFTLKDLQKVNPTVKSITIRNHVIRSVEKGILTRLSESAKTGKRGCPALRFVNTRIAVANLARKTKQTVAVEAVADLGEPTVV